ncbi:type IV pilus inner membrane component PilO [Desulforhopalus singaporensis]|uniref:Type IV pilus assembly protein PilO n=1 Tax=Desulforhopalus singaporensis TaxID=91360 RepID=A0A1H0SDS7_9BACT|nr:type 4a pilus biogenesis protein PilO [Desulforhopalus singaporensis]SDP39952.1 type IV pilus assembly protein PilO [Desulforhopalus singaporensis]
MKKGNSAFSSFIDNRFIPLSNKAKLVILVLIVALPTVAFYFAYYQPNSETIASLERQKANIEKQLAEVKRKAANLEKFEQELAQAQEKFLELAVLLPKEKEIPKLLKDISSLGRTAGLDFNIFKPLPDVPKDFYAEIPISIKVRGPYHNMGFFFDNVSKLERIVSVTNVKMSSPKQEQGEMLLNSDCRLLTYRFTNVELQKKKPKK